MDPLTPLAFQIQLAAATLMVSEETPGMYHACITNERSLFGTFPHVAPWMWHSPGGLSGT